MASTLRRSTAASTPRKTAEPRASRASPREKKARRSRRRVGVRLSPAVPTTERPTPIQPTPRGSVSVSHQSGRMEKIGASASTGPTMEMSPRLLARVRR